MSRRFFVKISIIVGNERETDQELTADEMSELLRRELGEDAVLRMYGPHHPVESSHIEVVDAGQVSIPRDTSQPTETICKLEER